jgi:hypothetical protein
MGAVRLQLVYDGAGPVHWDGGAGTFGLQDKDDALHAGTPGAAGAVVFDLTLQVKAVQAGAVVLVGDFAHGKPADRFLYLGWRNAAGNFAQRLKLPLASITPEQMRQAISEGKLLTATLVDHHPRATTTGANIGGTRKVAWVIA